MMLVLAFLLTMAPPDSVQLGTLHRAALEQDPRARAIALQAEISELRLQNLSTQHLPQFTAGGLASYQSEVSMLPIPGGPQLSKDHYQVTAEVNQLLYDGGMVAAQRALEKASRNVEQQNVRVEEHQLFEQVNDAYFGALLLQVRMVQLEELRKDVRARLDAAEARVKAGTATPGRADALRAELLQVAQQQAEVRYDRGTMLDVLHVLTGFDLGDDTKL
ncbi:MAG TPA: TolC family protein, partial [Rhodothermales bacterium]|nr:TolC family protein [Rhodothermales bacterium]